MSVDFFLHIPRSGGSSIRTLLTLNYPVDRAHAFSGNFEEFPNFLSRPQHERESLRLVHGHFPFGLHAGLRDVRYFTLIRDPIARHFSEYFYARKHPEHHAHERINNGQLTLEFWAEIGEHHAFYHNNTLCQYLSGDYQLRKPTYATFQAACSNLEKMHVFGLTERFEESVLMMSKYLGWKFPVYARRNVIMGASELPWELLEKARANQEWDVALYEFASELFAKRIRQESRLLFPALESYTRRIVEAGLGLENADQTHLVGEPLEPSIVEANQLDEESPIRRYLESPQTYAPGSFQVLPENKVIETLKLLEISRRFVNPQVFNRTRVRIWWLGLVETEQYPRLFHEQFGWFTHEGQSEDGQEIFAFDDPRVGRVLTDFRLFPVMIDKDTGKVKRFFRYKGTNVRLDAMSGDTWEVVADPFIPEQDDQAGEC